LGSGSDMRIKLQLYNQTAAWLRISTTNL
jgi:hypothetical protein